MPLNIKDPHTDRLARELAEATGETLTQAVDIAVRERLERITGRPGRAHLTDDLNVIAIRCARMPVHDDRSTSEILGYDEHGLPT